MTLLPRTIPGLLAAFLSTGCAAIVPSTGFPTIATKGQATDASTKGSAGSSYGMAEGMAPAFAPEAGGTIGDRGGTQQESGLKGGVVDDNADFAKYLDYQKGFRGNAFKVDVSNRVVLRVLDSASRSVPNAAVTIKAGRTTVFSGKTTSDGRVLFFPQSAALQGEPMVTEAARGGLLATGSIGFAAGSADLRFNAERGTIPKKLDIAFILDVTGSMGDELGRIQQTLQDVVARIKSLPEAPELRLGLVAFRDRSDDWVTRETDFTSDVSAFKKELDSLAASGGGDYPEAIQEALHTAVSDLAWDDGDTLRMAFLVGDAPPHLDYAQDHKYTDEALNAASKGIKVFPLAASGLDAQGEYVFRQLGQLTGGKFLFITYGGATPMRVGPVQANDLDDLVVGTVKAELANLD